MLRDPARVPRPLARAQRVAEGGRGRPRRLPRPWASACALLASRPILTDAAAGKLGQQRFMRGVARGIREASAHGGAPDAAPWSDRTGGPRRPGDARRAPLVRSGAGSSNVSLVPEKELFCYALVSYASGRLEETVDLLAAQFRAACDDWTFFGSREDPARRIVAAYSEEEERRALQHQMHEMVIAGAWRWLAITGAFLRHRWLVKVDPDSFVRPSTLRSALASYPPDFRSIVSVRDAHDPGGHASLEGFFLAVPATLVGPIYRESRHTRACDEFVSGHNEAVGDKRSPIDCPSLLRMPPPVAAADGGGFALVASDGEGIRSSGLALVSADGEAGSEGKKSCDDIGQRLLEFLRSSASARPPGAAPEAAGRFCGCRFLGSGPRPGCLSERFVAVHPVRDAEEYRRLAAAFP